MCSSTNWVQGAWCLVLGALLIGCAERQNVAQRSYFNIDSLVTNQVTALAKHQLNKSVSIGSATDQTSFTPDSLQWANELDVFRQLGQVNKASFRDAYVVSDIRDTNSNLMVREFKAQRPVPVTLMRVYYLRTPDDVGKIEATLVEENTLYSDTRRMILELERSHLLHRYRVEGYQKMVMDDSVRFVIAGEISM